MNKNFKRIIALIMCAVVFVLVFSSCGSGTAKTERITLSGKDNILDIDNNYALSAANYLEIIASEFHGGKAKKELRSFITDELVAAGYDRDMIEIQSFTAKSCHGKNIVLTVPGERTDKQIIVGAHYDGSGDGDNASGVALVLAQAVGFVNVRLPYTVKYIFFDLEEKGCLGSLKYAEKMSSEEVASTLFMVNADCVVFGDYAGVYGGKCMDDSVVVQTQSYELAMSHAKDLGFNVYGTDCLDGYFAEHGEGPALDPVGVFTNPWTDKNPPPTDIYFYTFSPAAPVGAGDYDSFEFRDIAVVVFNAANWFSGGNGSDPEMGYGGYYETAKKNIGASGMFMNTEYDTVENLEKYFPGRAVEHYNIYSPILSKLLLQPYIDE